MSEASTRRITAIVLVVLAVIAALAFAASRRSPAEQSTNASASPTAAPSSTLSTASPATTISATPNGTAPTSSASAATGDRYTNPTLGFAVTLPAPYRRSAHLSMTFQGDKPAAQDAFTARTPADEDALANPPCETACRIWNYVALVQVFPNEAGTGTPRDWYQRSSGAVGERIQDVTVDGRTAIRVDDGATYPVQYVIRDGARIFRVAYSIAPPELLGPPPAGASRDKLEQILASFHFTR
jgi:hypothetical protein